MASIAEEEEKAKKNGYVFITSTQKEMSMENSIRYFQTSFKMSQNFLNILE